MSASKTVTVDVIADPEHVKALAELVTGIAAAFRDLSRAVQEANQRYRLVLEELEREPTDT